MQFNGASEIDQDLYHPVEAMNFAADDVDMSRSIGLELGQLVAQVLQVKNNRVDGVFDFVGHARRQSSNRSKASRKLDLVFNLADRLGIPHGEKRADLGAALQNKIQRNLNFLTYHLHGFLREGAPLPERLQNQSAQLIARRKDFRDALGQNLRSWTFQKSLC